MPVRLAQLSLVCHQNEYIFAGRLRLLSEPRFTGFEDFQDLHTVASATLSHRRYCSLTHRYRSLSEAEMSALFTYKMEIKHEKQTH